jgi:uncharacterized protein DUF3300
MVANNAKQILSLILSIVLVGSPVLYGQQGQETNPGTGTGGGTESVPMSTSELSALVAPIALYPDALVAQVLAAATFPDQVAIASYWLGQNKNLTGDALMQAVDKQSWDASVKALTEFPTVLENMAKNLSWTSSLGEAYHNQQSEIMAAVQTLRAEAKAKGNLKSTSQITVVQQAPQTIVIEPANPQVVYVPQYNPAVIYGYPYVTPGYSAGDVAAAGVLGFGAGIAVGALMSGGGSCCGWGWGAWGCNWHGGTVVYNHNNFYGNAAWHGGYYNGGYHGGYGYNNAYNHANDNFNRGSGNFNRDSGNFKNVSGNTVNVNRNAQNFSGSHTSGSNSWAQHANGTSGRSTAFSGMSGHSGGFGDSGGWSSRAESGRGWGSMRSSGFGGGRFGGGGFGGGGFRGGGFRR